MNIWRIAASAALAAAIVPAAALAQTEELKSEEMYQVELADQMRPHWVWVNDVSFTRPLDGRAYLLDADSGQFLGMVSGGYAQGPLQITRDGKRFSMVSTYYSRGTRGERTDVATFYDIKTLDQTGEVVIPPKHFISLPILSTARLSDDDRFLLVYNFTPEQSVSVVDVAAGKLIGETATPGCALVYPVAPRRFFMQCSDSALQAVSISEAGALSLDATTTKLFSDDDPANEKPVRITPAEWLFITRDSEVRIVDGSGAVPKVKAKWSLLDKDTAEWRIGGLQPSAYHARSGRLYTLMHVGDRDTHKDPGTEVWVYDVAAGKRVQRIKLDGPATALAVSEDAEPLLYTVMFGVDELAVYDARDGTKRRGITGLGNSLSVIQPAPVAP
ncbi:amine dehydrogenase large subunit [Sphingomonas flavalba]|uniref:amine dehydrogenase large subunit n=1 Tax=Sphingomonas flavalba TaxID=2559804 RepID=UPI00109DEFAD|nr:amine dehydrogenase large subunit [Sphingomonas flavalba]